MRVVSIIAGIVLGSITLSVLTLLFHWIFFRPALRDGQYAIVFFFSMPMGALLGAMTGFSLACLWQRQMGTAGRAAEFGGGCLFILLLLFGLVLSGTQNPTLMERLAAIMFWCGLPLLWSVVLVCTGVRLRAGQ